ncbi:TonB-dependent siderophore receptor [Acetobacter indonesiensis]|uniref:TonB-dependent siderophore receptor n=1 Tax=Acetobacter indonesiensis TaxID=104101 RepID=UPI0039ED6AB3
MTPRFVLLCGCTLLALSSPSVHAEQKPAKVLAKTKKKNEEISVTGYRNAVKSSAGTKTDTPLIRTPQTITVITNAELQQRNALSLNQALTYVAGAMTNLRGGNVGRYDQMTIRGFTPALFLDGMRLLGGVYSTPQLDFHRVDSVDVIKGPASVLYGNSSPGGLINENSKTPLDVRQNVVDFSAGNYNLVRGYADLTGPLDAKKHFLYRLIGGGEKSDGFVRLTRNLRYYISPEVSYVPDENTSITFIGSYQRDPKNGSYGGVPAIGSVLRNPNGQLPRNFYDGDPNYEIFDRKQGSVSTLIRHRFNDILSFKSNFRYQRMVQSYRQVYFSSLNPNMQSVRRGAGGSDENYGGLTLDNSFTAKFHTGFVRHTVLAGQDYFDNNGNYRMRFAQGAANGVPDLNLYHPTYGYQWNDFVKNAPRTDVSQQQIGAYGQDQIEIGNLNLMGSIRHDWYQQKSTSSGSVSRLNQNKLTWRVGALYAFRFGLAPYFSYSTSFEPQTGANIYGTPYKPITGRQYEFGLKYQPKGTKTILTVSAYDLARQNTLITDPSNPLNSIQGGEVRTRGVEAEGRGEIIPGLNFTVALTYMESDYDKGNPATAGVINGSAAPGVTGTRALGAPTWMASTFLSYDFHQAKFARGAWRGFTIGGGMRYTGPSDGAFTSTISGATAYTRFAAPAYTLADLMMSYDFGALSHTTRNLSVQLNVNNVLNTKYVSSCAVTGWCWYGAARTAVGAVHYSF